MVTTLKRLTISLPDDVAEAVGALAKAQGVPQSKAIVTTLQEFAPTMLSLAKFMEQVKSGQKTAAKETIRHMMGDAMAELMREQMELVPAKKTGKKT